MRHGLVSVSKWRHRIKGQHFVPDSYLKAWCDPATPLGHTPYVHVFNKTGEEHRKRSPAKIMKMPELYTIFREGERDLSIEQHFGRIEREFVRVRKLIEAADYGGMPEVIALYFFTAGLMMRAPNKIAHFTKQFAEIADKARSIRLVPGRPPVSSFGPGPSMTISEMQQMSDDPMGTWFPAALNANTKALTQMFGCDILVNTSLYPFVTSDNPAAVIYREVDGEPLPRHFPRGLATRGCEITLPISPTHALRFTHKPPGVHDWLTLDWEGVFEVNFATITRAHELIVADREDLFFVQAILDRIREVHGASKKSGPTA